MNVPLHANVNLTSGSHGGIPSEEVWQYLRREASKNFPEFDGHNHQWQLDREFSGEQGYRCTVCNVMTKGVTDGN